MPCSPFKNASTATGRGRHPLTGAAPGRAALLVASWPLSFQRAARGNTSRPGRPFWSRAVGSLLSILLLLEPGTIFAQSGSSGPPPIRRSSDAVEWPEDFEIGLEASRFFVESFGSVDDDSLVTRVQDIGYRIACRAGHPDYLFTFNLLDMPDPNALALPGGFIFVTRGMLEQDISDEALGHLLGHEIAHVTERHFARSNRIEGLLTLLQTAIVVAALVAVPNSSSGGYDYDETEGRYRLSAGGKQAAYQGTSIFGGLFRELLVRGYSRGLEMEADEVGRRFAGRAGVPMVGGVELMEELHERIYEDQEFGYWFTHPFFEDRITKARAARDAGGSAPSDAEVMAYREGIQNRLAVLAKGVLDDDVAFFLYDSALRAGPRGPSGVPVAHERLRRAAASEHRKKEILRSYTPMVAEYDSLLTVVSENPEAFTESAQRRLHADRDDLVKERSKVYEKSRKIVHEPEAGVQFLELFLENFPDDPEAHEIRFRLAEQYRLADRPDEAALALDDLLRDTWTNEDDHFDWQQRTLASIRETLPQTEQLTTNQYILNHTESDSVRQWASSRLFQLASELDSLEIGSHYVAKYPDTEITPMVQERLQVLAQKRVLRARLHESLQRYQEALDEYHQVLLLAPGTNAAIEARAGIERVQRFVGS